MSGWIGRSIPRLEDQRFLTGRGQYMDDLDPPGTLHLQVVRSQHAHARIVAIDASGALAMQGVLLVATAAELAADGIGPVGLDFRPPGPAGGDPLWAGPLQPALAGDVARYVGEPVAFVIADSFQGARDAAEAVTVEYEPLEALTDTAAAPGAPTVLWPAFPDNVAFSYELGDAAAADAAMGHAPRVVRARVTMPRVIANPIEPRGALAVAEGGRLTLYVGTQRPHGLRQMLCDQVLHLDHDALRVVCGDVGGGFGAKNSLYPEHILCVWAARRLGAAVKWRGVRSEGLLADQHARDDVFDLALGVAADGTFLSLTVDRIVNLGAYASPRTFVPTYNGLALLGGFYRIPAAHARVRGVFSNTSPTTVYRGAGRPEVVYACERLVDLAARELGMDPIALRRRNAIERTDGPVNGFGATFGDADFRVSFERALAMVDHAGMQSRREAARRAGRLRGVGLAWYVENLHGPAKTKPAWLRADAAGERFEVVAGTTSNGQGHETAFLQIVADKLGLPLDALSYVQGDTDTVPDGTGTGASWSVTLTGSSLVLAADAAIEQGRASAGELLEAASSDIVYSGGEFRVGGTDRRVGWREVFAAAPRFVAVGHFDAYHEGYPVACHACECEVDPETGAVTLERFVVAQDAGRLVNPMIAAGQLHGGVAQGIGQALLEEARYDPDSGQLLTGSFMDYAMPRAGDLPSLECSFVDGPPGDNPLGVKGIGEAGATGAAPAVVNAVLDALAPLGVRHVDMPLTPLKVWGAVQEAVRGVYKTQRVA
jgi:carbon-monoxide dehydrogenase large subunit